MNTGPLLAFGTRIFAAGLSFLLGIVTARVLGVADFGTMNILLALVNIGVVFALLGQENHATRSVAQALERGQIAAIHRLRKDTPPLIWAAGIALAGLLGMLKYLFDYPLTNTETSAVVLFALLIPLVARIRLSQSIVRGTHQPALALLPDGVLRPALGIAGLLILAVSGIKSLPMVACVLVIATIICTGFALLIEDWRASLLPRQTGENSTPIQGKVISLSIYGSSILSVLTTQFAVVLVGGVAGDTVAGIYSAAEKVSLATSIFSQSIYLAVASRLAALHATGDWDKLRDLLRWYTRVVGAVSILIAAGVALFATEIMQFYGQGFSDGAQVLTVLLCSPLVTALAGPIGILLVMTNNEVEHLRSMAISVLLQVPIYLILSSLYGVIGAAISALIVTLIWNSLMMLAVSRKLPLRPILAWA